MSEKGNIMDKTEEQLAEEKKAQEAIVEEEVVVSIGEEKPSEETKEAAPWIKNLRKIQRETAKENRELKKKLADVSNADETAELGTKPTLENSDFDADKYEVKLLAWQDAKSKIAAKVAKEEEAKKKQSTDWQQHLNAYDEKKAVLKVADFEEAEAIVHSEFSTTQQGLIIQGAENPALVVYALGKSPKHTEELSKINDPVKFAFAVAKLESQLVVSKKTATVPLPEGSVKDSGNASTAAGVTLDKLREEAEKTGDYTKVAQYKREHEKE